MDQTNRPEDDLERRRAISAIMRRRKRARRPRANTKLNHRTGNWYTQVNLENTGSTTPGILRLFLALLGLACGIAPFWIANAILTFGDPSDKVPDFVPVLLLGTIIATFLICLVICLAAAAMLFKRILFPPKPKNKAR